MVFNYNCVKLIKKKQRTINFNESVACVKATRRTQTKDAQGQKSPLDFLEDVIIIK